MADKTTVRRHSRRKESLEDKAISWMKFMNKLRVPYETAKARVDSWVRGEREKQKCVTKSRGIAPSILTKMKTMNRAISNTLAKGNPVDSVSETGQDTGR